jgi:hypothetical protein
VFFDGRDNGEVSFGQLLAEKLKALPAEVCAHRMNL